MASIAFVCLHQQHTHTSARASYACVSMLCCVAILSGSEKNLTTERYFISLWSMNIMAATMITTHSFWLCVAYSPNKHYVQRARETVCVNSWRQYSHFLFSMALPLRSHHISRSALAHWHSLAGTMIAWYLPIVYCILCWMILYSSSPKIYNCIHRRKI